MPSGQGFSRWLLLAAIAVAAFLFNVDRSVRVPYDLIARTNVTGLFTDAAVRYRGLDVGKVQSIKFDRDHPGQILIRILVDTHAPITHSTFGSLGFQGVTGIAFIQLDDNGRDPSPLASSVKDVAQLPMRPGLLDQLQQRGDVLLRKLEKVTDDVDNLLSPEMVSQLQGTAASIQKAADGVATLTQQMAPAAGKLPATINQLDRTLASTNELITESEPPGRSVRDQSEQGRHGGATGGRRAGVDGWLVAGAVVASRLRHAAARQFARRRRALRGPLGGPRCRHVQHQSAQRAVRRAARGAGPGRSRLYVARARAAAHEPNELI